MPNAVNEYRSYPDRAGAEHIQFIHVTDVDGLFGIDAALSQGMPKDGRVGLGGTGPARRDDRVEAVGNAESLEQTE